MINIRDPVDRFHSNFYWRAKIICRPKERDTRTIGDHVGNPFEHCTTAQQSIGTIILNKYREDANVLAEGLCSDDLHERSIAHQDMASIGHSSYSISDWLAIRESLESNFSFQNLTAVVLEPGFPFGLQVDSAIKWIVAKCQVLTGLKRRLHSISASARVRHSSKVNITTSNFTIAPPKPLSDLATCCVARYFYKTDYQLLFDKNFKNKICQGHNKSICEGAIDCIVQRRRWIFSNQSLPCREVVGPHLIKENKEKTISRGNVPRERVWTNFSLASILTCFVLLKRRIVSICG